MIISSLLFALAWLAAAPPLGQNAKPDAAPPAGRLHNNLTILADKSKTSYAIGVALARDLRKQGGDINVDALAKGLRDGLSGSKIQISEQDLQEILTAYQTEVRRRRVQSRGVGGLINKKESMEFLAANRAKPGVVTLPSGLQYRVLAAGHGRRPTDSDTVECHYRGSLIDGTEFDNSYRRSRPAILKVSALIRGWSEALKLMPVGSRWHLFVPAELAYGPKGAGSIGPNATLIIEVELLAIK